MRTIIDLANQEHKVPISLKDIALRQDISVKYLESIIAVLHKAGFVTSTRGKNGGYVLTRKPADYTVGSVLKLTEKSLAPVNCVENENGICSRAEQCFTLPLWQELDRIIDQYLESVTIEDLLSQTVVKNQEGPL